MADLSQRACRVVAGLMLCAKADDPGGHAQATSMAHSCGVALLVVAGQCWGGAKCQSALKRADQIASTTHLSASV